MPDFTKPNNESDEDVNDEKDKSYENKEENVPFDRKISVAEVEKSKLSIFDDAKDLVQTNSDLTSDRQKTETYILQRDTSVDTLASK